MGPGNARSCPLPRDCVLWGRCLVPSLQARDTNLTSLPPNKHVLLKYVTEVPHKQAVVLFKSRKQGVKHNMSIKHLTW